MDDKIDTSGISATGRVNRSVSRHIRTLGEIIEQATRTGETLVMTQEEWDHFRSEFSAVVGPEIDRIRSEQRRAWAEARHLVVD